MIFIYTFFRNSPTDQTRRRIFTHDGSNDFFHITAHLGGQKTQFWGVNRRFQAKLAKSKNVHIIKATASIPAKFCTVIRTTKCPSWVVPTHTLQIQYGGRPPSLKINKLLYLSRASRILTKFSMRMQFDPLDGSDR